MLSISPARSLRTLAALFLVLGLLPGLASAASRIESISDPSVLETDGGTTTLTFDVQVICENEAFVTVNWVLNDGTAMTGDSDYVDDSGSFGQLCNSLNEGTFDFQVNVAVNGDIDIEPDEMFTLQISASVGSPSFVGDRQGTGTILNDDAEVCGNSVIEGSEQCDEGSENSAAFNCCTITCEFRSGTCRASGGSCDLQEVCSGSDALCGPDLKSTAECNPSQGVCDLAEICDGQNNSCPADGPNLTSVCNAAAGICDVEEVCSDASDDCPVDSVLGMDVECRGSQGVCDIADFCDGTNTDCPADEKSTELCRPEAGLCDVPDFCDGIGDDCPADELLDRKTLCRASTGDCDPKEFCTGTDALCPLNAVVPRCGCNREDYPDGIVPGSER